MFTEKTDQLREHLQSVAKSKMFMTVRNAILAFLTLISLTAKTTIPDYTRENGLLLFIWNKFTQLFEHNSFELLLLFILLLLFFSRETKRYAFKTVSVIVCSVVLGFSILTGRSFLIYDDFSFLLGNRFQVGVTFLMLLGYTFLFYYLIEEIFDYLSHMKIQSATNKRNWIIFLLSFLFLLLCYLPYIVSFYPGSMNSDTTDQMSSFFGYKELTNHYPIFSTWLIGVCLQLGKHFNQDNLGAFFYCILQTIVMCLTFANSIRVLRKWNTPKSIQVIVLCFYGLVPFFGGYAQFLIKDTLYAVLIALFTTVLLDIIWESRNEEKTSYWKYILLGIVGIFASLIRNNGIYVVVPSVLVICAIVRNKRVRIPSLITTGSILLFYLLWMNCLIPGLDIEQGSVKEALSIPFQQTARYIQDYGDEITEEERSTIDVVLDYNTIQNSYVTWGSDPVKNTYKEHESSYFLKDYFVTWFKMFLKHPDAYINATIGNSYFYYCPNINQTYEPIFLTFQSRDENGMYFDFHFVEDWQKNRTKLEQYSETFRNTPILGMLYSQGFYSCLLFVGITYCFYKKRRGIALCTISAVISLLVCIASPINGSFRYFFPIICIIPMTLMFIFLICRGNEKCANSVGK